MASLVFGYLYFANLPPVAKRENPLSCKYIAGGDCALEKSWLTKVVGCVVARALDSCGKDGWFKFTPHQHHLS
jgi:hypothetical protein